MTRRSSTRKLANSLAFDDLGGRVMKFKMKLLLVAMFSLVTGVALAHGNAHYQWEPCPGFQHFEIVHITPSTVSSTTWNTHSSFITIVGTAKMTRQVHCNGYSYVSISTDVNFNSGQSGRLTNQNNQCPW